MRLHRSRREAARQGRSMLTMRGMTLIEVLIALLVVSFGMLGLASLQSKTQTTSWDAYQRAQANILLDDIADRIRLDNANYQAYLSDTPYGTGTTPPDSCAGLAAGSARNICQWNQALLGVAEQEGEQSLGGMIDARGCIEEIQPANPDPAVCMPAILRITTVWQGMVATDSPFLACGQGLYGADDGYRRAVSMRLVIGIPECG